MPAPLMTSTSRTNSEPVPPDQRLAELVLAGLALTTESTLNGVLQRVVEIGSRVVGGRYAALAVLGPDNKSFERFVIHGMTTEEQRAIGHVPEGHGVLALPMRTGHVVRIADVTQHPAFFGFPQNHPAMRSFLGVPVSGRRGTFGHLYFTNPGDSEEFTEDDEHIAALLAAMASAAIENAELHEERRRLLAEVQGLHRTRERFYAMVNHELRNALAAVYGWAEMLVRKKDPATIPRAAHEVLESTEFAVSLVNDLLDLGRLDEDRLKPVIRVVDPAGLVRHAVSREFPAAEAKQVTFQLNLFENVPPIPTDASRVEQILVNLIGNAIKHTPTGSTITITVQGREESIRIRVQDEGPGVAMVDAERIFDVYITTADEERQGVGLGLPLSRRLARLLGGELHVVPRDGAGVFILELPITRGPQ